MFRLLSLALLLTLIPSGTGYHNPSVFTNTKNKLILPSTSTPSDEQTTTQIPEQVRLTFTSSPTEMGVYWVTSNSTGDDYVPTVNYGVGSRYMYTDKFYSTSKVQLRILKDLSKLL